jgi:hypothetical protein
MPPERCLISFRLACVCRTCKRATWPAHIAADLSIYCADCCEACRLDRAPVENPRAKAPGRRAIRSARPGKRGDTRPPEPGPCCAVSGPARDAASVKPSEAAPRRKGRAVDRGPSENRLAKGPLAGAVALPGPAEQDLAMTADGPHRASAGRRLQGGAASAWRRACGLRQARSRPLRTCVSGRDFCLSGPRKRLFMWVWRGQNFFSGPSPFSSPPAFRPASVTY